MTMAVYTYSSKLAIAEFLIVQGLNSGFLSLLDDLSKNHFFSSENLSLISLVDKEFVLERSEILDKLLNFFPQLTVKFLAKIFF